MNISTNNKKNTSIQLTKRTTIEWLFSKKFFKKFLIIDSLGDLPVEILEKKSKNPAYIK